jgi:hypothetical protein
MSTDLELAAGQRLVARIRDVFPTEAALVDRRLQGDGFVVDEAPYIWVEHFSQRTTDALKGGDLATFQAHLKLLSTVLASADEPTTRCIDVAYVESLMWDVKDQTVLRQGWRLIPTNLQALYVALWGERPFMG